MTPQLQEKPQKRKQKEKPKLEFSPAKVFDVEASEDVQLDIESAQFKARKGEGGDRRTK